MVFNPVRASTVGVFYGQFLFAFRSGGITIGLTMKPLTVKIPESLEEKLRSKAKAANVPVSEIVRRALTREMESDAIDFSKLAAPYVGMFFGPSDLSTREGYGSRESR